MIESVTYTPSFPPRIAVGGKLRRESNFLKELYLKWIPRSSRGMTSSPFWNSPESGFTLLELVVALFVISLVLAIALPSFTGIGEGRIRSDATRISSIIRYLNDSAISTKETLQMKIALSDKSINYNGPEGEKSERFETLQSVELQSKGMISEGEVTIFFGPSGAGESFKTYLKEDQTSMEVALNSMNGRVKVTQSQNEK